MGCPVSTAAVLIVAALVLIGVYLWHAYAQVIDLMWPRDDDREDLP